MIVWYGLDDDPVPSVSLPVVLTYIEFAFSAVNVSWFCIVSRFELPNVVLDE